MYVTKLNFESWTNDINLVRVWLFIECIYFFMWILSGALFAFVAYIVKFKPTFKTEAAMAADDNVWNDKWSDDFLRFLKFDMFLVCFIISYLLIEIYIGFGNHDHIDRMGGPRGELTNLMFGLMILSRTLQLLHNIKKMKDGK